MEMAVKQCGHSLVVGAAAGAGFCIRFMARTRMKITKAMMMKSKMVR